MKTATIDLLYVKEMLEFENGQLCNSRGVLSFMNFFEKLEIDLENMGDILDLDHNDGSFKVVRDNATMNIWNPFVLKYGIKNSKSPLCISNYENDTIKINVENLNVKIESLKFDIYLSYQNIKPIVDILPRNLSHKFHFKNDGHIIWNIDSPRNGSDYSIIFSKKLKAFKVIRMVTTYNIPDALASELCLKTCKSTIDSIAKNVPILLRTEIKETKLF